MNHRTRLIAALLAMAALAFSQLAVSAFACPSAAAPMAEMPAGPCDQGGNANLCDRHCDYGAASVGHGSVDLTLDVLALPLPWREEPVAIVSLPARAPREFTARSHSPPPLALFGALRI